MTRFPRDCPLANSRAISVIATIAYDEKRFPRSSAKRQLSFTLAFMSALLLRRSLSRVALSSISSDELSFTLARMSILPQGEVKKAARFRLDRLQFSSPVV